MDRRLICPISVGLEGSPIRPKSKLSDVVKSEDSDFYLLATEGNVFASESSDGSFLAHKQENKKKLPNRPTYRRFLGELTK